MRKFNFFKAILLLTFMAVFSGLKAQEVRLELKNDAFVSSTEYQFDIFLRSANAAIPFECASVQVGVVVNPLLKVSPQTLSASIVAGTSELNANITPSLNFTNLNGTRSVISVVAKTPPGVGSGQIINTTGVRVFRVSLTNAAGFPAGVKPNLTFGLSTATYNTVIKAYVGSTNTTMISGPSTNIAWLLTSGLTNPELTPVTAYDVIGSGKNVTLIGSQLGVVYQLYKGGVAEGTTVAGTGAALAPASWTNLADGIYTIKGTRTATFHTDILMNGQYEVMSVVTPTAFNVTGSGSYCVGSAANGTVTLSGSEAAFSYQLYKDAVAEGTPVVGTGAALVWNNLVAGVYTVKATDAATTAMTGDVTVTESQLAPTPNVSVVNNCDGTSTLTIDNAAGYTEFVWTGGLAATNPTTANVAGTYTVTQSAVGGCTSLPSADAIAAPKQTPAVPTISEMPNCGNSEFSLQNLAVGATVKWYDGVNLVHTGDIYTVYTNVTNLTATQEIAGCVSAASIVVSSNIIPSVTPAVSIVADANNVCAGTSVTFTPTPVNGGTTPTYEWFVGAVSQGTSATFAYVPVDGNAVSCVMTSNDGCASPLTATSNAVNMIVNPILPVSVSIAADASTVCAGTTVTFTATPENGGTPTYQWKVNGTDVGTGSTTYAYAPANNDEVTCVMTSTLTGCISGNPATSNAVNMIVNPILPASVSIIASDNNVCAGTSVTYTATPVNGGTAHYNWHINGNTQGNDSPTFAYSPANGDQVYVVMTSDLACISGPATSNTVNTTVNTPAIPSVTISQSNNGNPILPGTNVTFTATPTNGGPNPTYIWKVLSNPGISTGATPTFTYAPAEGDLVTVEMTSDLTCVQPSLAVANSMTIIYLYTPSVAIAADVNNVCAGTTVTYTATPTNGGGSPEYQWKVNGNNVGTSSDTYAYVPSNGDIVTCVLTSSMFNTPTATSNAVTMVIKAVPAAPIVTVQNNCNNSVLTAGYWGGTLAWSNGAFTPSITVLTEGSYTVTQTVNGCTSPAGTGVAAFVAPTVQSITISSSANPSVAGLPVSYQAVATPFAVGQTYTWYLNNVAQTTSNTYAFSFIPTINGTYQIRCEATSLGCFLGGVSNTIAQVVNPTPNVTNTWLGISEDWHNAANWSNGIPLANHNVVIPANVVNFPKIDNLAAAVCNNITITNGAQLINNGTLTIGSKVYAQQLLTASKWHFISSPINDATAYAFSNINPNNFNQNLYLQNYNEAWNGTGSPWVNITDGFHVMSAGKGYEAWSDNNHIITMEGTQLNNNVAPIVLSKTAGPFGGFNLIGNPYPSGLNASSLVLNSTETALYIWNNGNFESHNSGVGFTYIPSMQSFFAIANANGNTVTISNNAKAFGGSFYKSALADVLKLKVSGNTYNDIAYIRFNSNATANYDGQFDAEKIFGINDAPQFYSTISGKNLSINTLPSLTSPVVVPMSLNVGANTTYTITASEMNSFANGTTITLEDTKTATFTNLMQQAVYTFTASPSDNANRFKLHFGVNGINENANGNISIYSNSNVIYVNNNSNEVVKEIVVMNVLGQEILNKKAANTTVNTITMDVASAYYVVKVVTASKVYTEKVYVK